MPMPSLTWNWRSGSFRTNTACERWWEGRKLWGELVNTSRGLAIKFNAILPKGGDRGFLARVNSLYKAKRLSGDQLIICNGELSALSNICGACERIAEEIEDPFGKDPNDLPLTRMVHTIEQNTADLLR